MAEIPADKERPPAAATPGSDVSATLGKLGSVVAPTSLLTALFFYFGWARINAQAHYLGLDDSVLGYSTRDYILRSISGTYLPLGTVLLIGLVWVWGHILVTDWIERRAHLKAVRYGAIALVALGVVVFSLGVVEQFLTPASWDPIIVPISLALTVALLSYSFHLFRALNPHHDTNRQDAQRRWLATTNIGIVTLLLALSLFWAVADYAGAVGRGLAIELLTHPERRPGVIVYSAKRLYITAASTKETALADPESAYRYSYSGLRLLERTGGKFFLVPDDWLQSRVTIVLPDNDNIRLEYTF